MTLDRDVVVKVLSDETTSGVSADRFRREIQVIAKLQHAHVVPILSAGVADGSLYYVMPFVSGETMRARLVREGPLPIGHGRYAKSEGRTTEMSTRRMRSCVSP